MTIVEKLEKEGKIKIVGRKPDPKKEKEHIRELATRTKTKKEVLPPRPKKEKAIRETGGEKVTLTEFFGRKRVCLKCRNKGTVTQITKENVKTIDGCAVATCPKCKAQRRMRKVKV